MVQKMHTLIIAIHDSFDYGIPNAAHSTRMAYYHGFNAIGINGVFARHSELAETIKNAENPLAWLTYDDYNYMDAETLLLLRAMPHFVQVNVWADGVKEMHRRYNAPSPTIPKETRKRILDSGASFLWASTPPGMLGAYENWIKAGQRVVGLPWACDTAIYHPHKNKQKFSTIDVAFVGGYRSYKEPQYSDYLWSWRDRLTTYGYSIWPQCYAGQIAIKDEPLLYQNARVCPTISEPQFCETHDTVERGFKVLGSGGLTIFDCVSAYQHLFTKEEALLPETIDQYRDMMHLALTGDDFNARWRERGYKAVMERHTCVHRARRVLELLELDDD